MLRLLIFLIIVVSIFIYGLKYAKISLVRSSENSISLNEVGKSVKEMKENNMKRKKTIKENEMLLEDMNEKY